MESVEDYFSNNTEQSLHTEAMEHESNRRISAT